MSGRLRRLVLPAGAEPFEDFRDLAIINVGPVFVGVGDRERQTASDIGAVNFIDRFFEAKKRFAVAGGDGNKNLQCSELFNRLDSRGHSHSRRDAVID